MVRSLLLALVCATAARAADFDVSPTRLELSAQQRTGHLTLRNPGATPLRLQVQVKAWQQGVEGEVQLSDTDEVSLFPSLFELAPGASRSVRLGVGGGEGAVEKTYRVLIDELPERALAGGAVQVVTRLSVPLFFGRQGLRAGPELTAPVLQGGAVAFSVRNVGTSRFIATRALVQGEDGAGRVVVQGEAAGWYVLAGGERKFVVAVRGEAAERVARVVVQVETDGGLLRSEVRLP